MNSFLRVQNLHTLVNSCRGLRELKLAGRRDQTALTDQDAVFLFDGLQDSLASLTFDLKNLGTPTLHAILACSQLYKLHLHGAHCVCGEMLHEIAMRLPLLADFKLCGARQLTSEDFCQTFVPDASLMTQLSALDVSGCWRLDDRALRSIADCCGQHLQRLTLHNCKLVTPKAVEYCMKRCPRLQQLRLPPSTTAVTCLSQ
ncbi:F-box/LRR-repeat protein 7-like isoform X2 [Periplaneta americana]